MLFASAVSAEELISVTVRDADFTVIQQIEGKRELAAFKELFENRIETKKSKYTKWVYKVDINPGDRWLYNKSGHFTVLSKANTPVYKVNSVSEMNAVLGIHNK